jgi:hypothetical protein
MAAIYAFTALVGAMITSALARSVGQHEDALCLLAWGMLGGNMAILPIIIRLLYSEGSGSLGTPPRD